MAEGFTTAKATSILSPFLGWNIQKFLFYKLLSKIRELAKNIFTYVNISVSLKRKDLRC